MAESNDVGGLPLLVAMESPRTSCELLIFKSFRFSQKVLGSNLIRMTVLLEVAASQSDSEVLVVDIWHPELSSEAAKQLAPLEVRILRPVF